MKKIVISLFSVILIASITIAIGGKLWLDKQFKTPNNLKEEVLFDIPKGVSAKKIASILLEKNIIKSSDMFYIYCRLNNVSNKLKSGLFLIPPNLNIIETVKFLIIGKEATKKITIPEGRASWEIYSILSKHYKGIDSLTWENLIHNKKYVNSLGLKKIPNLEGYLLADTYQFPYIATEKKLIEIMVSSTQNVISEYSNSKSEVLKKYGWHGVLTLASIVEEETGIPQERPRIAGVFYNRLKQGISLGADPTVRFIYRSLTGPIYQSQLDSNNPYNTRKFTGLPPGPISNPGKKAIEAALNPMKSNDLFFVAKDDGSKTHFFCPSMKCHNKYKDIAARNRGE